MRLADALVFLFQCFFAGRRDAVGGSSVLCTNYNNVVNRPRHSWIQQIGDGTPFSIRAEWSKARRRGHSGLTQRTSAVYAI